MSNVWDLRQLLADLHDGIEHDLATARRTLAHTTSKGDATENVWLQVLNTYLPKRYTALKGHVIDSQGQSSDQMDIMIVDQQYSPFIFCFKEQTVVPAESVYAVFETKQSLNATHVGYAQAKAASVRALHRTSQPIPHAGGTYDPKEILPVLAGLLTFESDWNPALGQPLQEALEGADLAGQLDLGCVVAHGWYSVATDGSYEISPGGKPATAFLFDLIRRLQLRGTAPMIDIAAYAAWLT